MSRFGFLAGLVSVIGLTACAANGPTESEELSGLEEGTGEAAQEIGGDGASTYYIVTHPDYRKCAYPFCGGVFVKRVNQAKTKCATGGMDAECHAVDVDLSATGLDDAAAADFSAAFTQGQGLVRGELKSITNEYGQKVKTLVATEAWRAAGEAAPTGTFYGVTSNGVQCITFPCASLTEEKLNTSAVLSIHDLDLSASGADEGETAKAQEALSDGGILVAGTHETFTGPGGTGTRLVGNALYLRLQPGPSICGGIAGFPCPEGYVCETEAGTCGVADNAGTCVPQPELCADVYDPVCGCDGVTYSNDCYRLAAGAGLDHAGECAPKGQACGDTVCGEGLECCNASCGWCVPPGTFCIQIACLPTE